MVGVHRKQEVVGQEVFMVVALSVNFHEHFSAPRQPQFYFAAFEIDGTIIARPDDLALAPVFGRAG